MTESLGPLSEAEVVRPQYEDAIVNTVTPGSARKRYSADQLLSGAEHVSMLNKMTAWAMDGEPAGREIA